MIRKVLLIGCFVLVSLALVSSNVVAQQIGGNPKDIAGEFFGNPVPLTNYYFAKRLLLTYGASWRGSPKDEAELEDLVWQELLFSFDAFRRGLEVTEDDVDKEVEKILATEKVEFSWRIDKEEFGKWVETRLKVNVDLFRNQIEHLAKIEKLRKEVIESIEPEVTEEDAFNKFLNEYNTLLVELVQFDDLEEAKKFYESATKAVEKGAFKKLIWDEILLSQQAYKKKIKCTDEEIDEFISSMLREKEARFKWKEDSVAYKEWTKAEFGLSVDDFQDYMVALVRVEKMYKENPDFVPPKAYQKLLEKSDSIALAYEGFVSKYVKENKEILSFESFQEAMNFYLRLDRISGFWEDEKRKDRKRFKRPGFVALDFLINMWGFKRDDAYKMMGEAIGTYYPPAPIYKGYGVFKILQIRKADESEFESRKQYYFDRVKSIKKYEGFTKWIEDLKASANVKRFVQ